MIFLFYLNMVIAALATLLAITRINPIHSLLYFIVSLLSAAALFFLAGAPFAAALELIIYAGAIIVLILFVVMMVERGMIVRNHTGHSWMPLLGKGPSILSAVVLAELLFIIHNSTGSVSGNVVTPKTVGMALFSNYFIGIELASTLLLAALIGVYHLGRCILGGKEEKDGGNTG